MNNFQKRIIAIVFGVSSGVTVMEFKIKEKPREILRADIPWEKSTNGAICMPTRWLATFFQMIKNYATSGDVITGATWGADLHWSSPSIQHYQSVQQKHLEMVKSIVPPLEIYLNTGGVNVDIYQPYAQLEAIKKRWPQIKYGSKAIIPFNDHITWYLSEERKHDPNMLNSQGLLAKNWRSVYEKIFEPNIVARIRPWALFQEQELITESSGIIIVPFSHDSLYSRITGFAECESLLWTGSWFGSAHQVDPSIKPNEKTFEAQISFEGLGSKRSAITNVKMFGAIYKELLRRLGLSYKKASEYSLPFMRTEQESHLSDEDIRELPNDATSGADFIMKKAEKKNRVVPFFIKTVAYAGIQKDKEVAKTLDLEQKNEIGVTGGFAENEAFLEALRVMGYKVYIPSFAAISTHAGLAADALVRLGVASTYNSALKKFVN
ncbi:MAG: hypothetical protein NTZ42_04800 [Candidatus Gribaldobacteria bacterium]|nr:hypothetical protein [Candidatus Gribaldobacteria bacterium]